MVNALSEKNRTVTLLKTVQEFHRHSSTYKDILENTNLRSRNVSQPKVSSDKNGIRIGQHSNVLTKAYGL